MFLSLPLSTINKNIFFKNIHAVYRSLKATLSTAWGSWLLHLAGLPGVPDSPYKVGSKTPREMGTQKV